MSALTGPSVQDVAEAIGGALSQGGIRYLPYLGDSVNPPVALVAINKNAFHEAFHYAALHEFIVMVVVSRADDRAGIEALEGYMSNTGPTSVRDLLETDPTLGGTVSACTVRECGPPAGLPVGQSGVVYLSCPFRTEVRTDVDN